MSTSDEMRKMDDEQLDDLNEEIGALTGEVEVAGAIDEDSAKVFTARSVILSGSNCKRFLDAHGYKGLALEIPSPLPVMAFGQNACVGQTQIGFAHVAWEGDVLVATMTASYATTERLLIETEKVYLESTFIGRPGHGVKLASLWLTLRKPEDDAETHLIII